MASPRCFVIHLGNVDVIGVKLQLPPTPINNPQIKYTCQSEVTTDIKINPPPVNSPRNEITRRGPNLSVNRPLTKAKNPAIIIDSE